jgi:hypothetical protein
MKPTFWIYIIVIILTVLAIKYLSWWGVFVSMVICCCAEIVLNLNNRD